MTIIVPYINGLMTVSENVFNACGYLPKDRFPTLNAQSTKWRFRFGLMQAVSGIALVAIGVLADCLTRKPDPKKYLTLMEQMVSLGQLYINHGVFNIIRSYIEAQGLGFLTAPYDFYGRKFLPALAESFDFQSQLFELTRGQLNRVQIISLFPPKISLRSY